MGVKSANWWQKFTFYSAYGIYLANRPNRINRLYTNEKCLEGLGRRSARQKERSELKSYMFLKSSLFIITSNLTEILGKNVHSF